MEKSPVSVEPTLSDHIRDFRASKKPVSGALILKVDREKMSLVIDEELEDFSLDDLNETLPEQAPRFVFLRHRINHKDGHTSYPLALIFYSPKDCQPELQMIYAQTAKHLMLSVNLARICELRLLEDLSEEWLLKQLQLTVQ
jgi:hypothetical protein